MQNLKLTKFSGFLRKCGVQISDWMNKYIIQSNDSPDLISDVNFIFTLWLKNQTETLMAKGYGEMAEEDKASADVTFEAQREILK